MGRHFLGIDLGSSFTKFVVIDNEGTLAYHSVIPTLSRRREGFEHEMSHIRDCYGVTEICATGYGRGSVEVDLQKTELICAAAGVSTMHPEHKCIMDIGGEDIKVIESNADGSVIDFFMNDKCSAGTGTFITEIAERSEIDIEEMNELARKSKSTRIMNSFCTVFAKSEVLGWKFGGMPIEDIARGIYLSVVDRVSKLPLRKDLPLYLCGGVIAYHSFLAELLCEATGAEARIVDRPQFAVALGAAIIARKRREKSRKSG